MLFLKKVFPSTNIIFVVMMIIDLLINANAISYDSRSTITSRHSTVRFVAFGDWGSDDIHQKEDAKAIGEWCEINRCDFILSTGDNFYFYGVNSTEDPRFKSTWSDVYSNPSINELTWLVVAGNHDHGNGADDGREWFQVEYSRLDPRWHFPNLAYSVKIFTNSTVVKLIGFDSESLRHNKNEPERMLNFMEDELNDSETDWKIMFGHHPAYSAGPHRGSNTIRKQVVPLMKRNGVDVYLTGHEHNQEHWQTQNNPTETDHITIGSGGYELHPLNNTNLHEMEGYTMKLQSFVEDYGFAYVIVSDTSIECKFVNRNLEVVYEYTRYKWY